MSTTGNEIWLQGERLDLGPDTFLFPNFQSYNRLEPGELASDYTETLRVPGTARNHRLLGHAAAAQATTGTAYKRLTAVLTSGGVETLPVAILEVISYSVEEGYEIRVTGGNRRFVTAIEGKTLQDLNLSRFDHLWTPANVLSGLPYAHWYTEGWGYMLHDRGKPIFSLERPLVTNKVTPYSCYPAIKLSLVWEQLLAEAGFTATPLETEPLFDALNLPTATPYVYPDEFREDRRLVAGIYRETNNYHSSPFVQEVGFNYVDESPYGVGAEVTLGAPPYRYTVPTVGYYSISLNVYAEMNCQPSPSPGEVGFKLSLFLNGVELANDEAESENGVWDGSLSVQVESKLLQAGDVLSTRIEGKELPGLLGGPFETRWYIGESDRVLVDGNYEFYKGVEPSIRFSVTLEERFPEGGLVRLSDWLPRMSLLDFVRAVSSIMGLCIQTDKYDDHLHLTTGERVLSNAQVAKDWSSKLDIAATQGLPERNTGFRLGGDFAQRNRFIYAADETEPRSRLAKNAPAPLYLGDGELLIADEHLPADAVLVELPFAATHPSKRLPGMLRILTFEATDSSTPANSTPENPDYSDLEPEPRITLRTADGLTISGNLVMVPYRAAGDGLPERAQVTHPFSTTCDYFVEGSRPFDLSAATTLLPRFWADTAATLKEARFLTEQLRLSALDVAELDFSVPVWIASLGDFYLLSKITEFSAASPTEVQMLRLHPTLLPPPLLNGGQEFDTDEFYSGEFF